VRRAVALTAEIFAVALVAGAISIIIGWKFLSIIGGSQASGSLPASPPAFSMTDTVTIWLGLLGVMVAASTLVVTAVGVLIGVLAFFGYAFFRQELPKTADEAARKAADNYFQGKVFERKMEDKIKQNMTWTSGTVDTISSVSIPSPESEQPIDEQASLAEKYPKENDTK
jgi:hypothetical protein